MFIDYYEILDIPISATLDDIKIAFKKQALKWHPDKNPGIDTTMEMQEINEAYLILKDFEAREKYDIEYRKFNAFKKERSTYEETSNSQKTNNSSERKDYKKDYEFDDEVLKKWMDNARRQAVDLAKQTIKEMKILSVDATKAAGSKMLEMFIGYFVAGIIILVIFKACN